MKHVSNNQETETQSNSKHNLTLKMKSLSMNQTIKTPKTQNKIFVNRHNQPPNSAKKDPITNNQNTIKL